MYSLQSVNTDAGAGAAARCEHSLRKKTVYQKKNSLFFAKPLMFYCGSTNYMYIIASEVIFDVFWVCKIKFG